MLGEAVERPIIVDGVYDKEVLDIDAPWSMFQGRAI
ncbi:unnamed protein product [Nippostrongylus brasiliensis]|uniref:Transposase n=1 Tax=Nippostrongylus brasiliensis TaxID=27835 RepID=A0A0N4XSR7_NIPBR|nr:unnamed protein product [Nippostrongylus brasiliensis]